MSISIAPTHYKIESGGKWLDWKLFQWGTVSFDTLNRLFIGDTRESDYDIDRYVTVNGIRVFSFAIKERSGKATWYWDLARGFGITEPND